MSSASQQSYKLLKDFAPKRRALNQVMNFQPHYVVFGVENNNAAMMSSMMSNLCLDASSSEFCAEDTDGPGPVTGANVLHENVRQLCIHEVYKVEHTPEMKTEDIQFGVFYSPQYWAYVEQFGEACPLEGSSPEKRFGLACSVKLMQKVGIDQSLVDACVIANTTRYLKRERDNQAWSPRAMRINGWRYSGMLDADLIARAICSGFVEQPQSCSLLKPRDHTAAFKTVEGYSAKQMILMLPGVAGISAVLMPAYKRSMTHRMRQTLREEVMLEVQSQLGDYRKMAEGGGGGDRYNKGLPSMAAAVAAVFRVLVRGYVNRSFGCTPYM